MLKVSKEFLEEEYFIKQKSWNDIALENNIPFHCIQYAYKKFGIKSRANTLNPKNKKRLVGQKFGKLTVLEGIGNTKKGLVIWKCKCDCGNIKNFTTTCLRYSKSCGCLNHRTGPNSSEWTGYGEISGGYWDNLKQRNKYKKFEFSITIEEIWELFLKQDRKCVFSGIELKFTTNHRNKKGDQTASLDRIDSSKGYITGNIQWVHKRINMMKQSMKDEDFINWCRLIAKNRENG